jgi:hypothetical protein
MNNPLMKRNTFEIQVYRRAKGWEIEGSQKVGRKEK